MAIVSREELRQIVGRVVPRSVTTKGALGPKGEGDENIKATLRDQVKRNLDKLGR